LGKHREALEEHATEAVEALEALFDERGLHLLDGNRRRDSV
jgi:hypothetical protein